MCLGMHMHMHMHMHPVRPQVCGCVDKDHHAVYTTDACEVALPAPPEQVHGLLVEFGRSLDDLDNVPAGTTVTMSFTEYLLESAFASATLGPVGYSNREPFAPFEAHGERCAIEEATPSSHGGVHKCAPALWPSTDLSWTLTRLPASDRLAAPSAAPGSGRVVGSGVLQLNAQRRFSATARVTEAGTYELTAHRNAGRPDDGPDGGDVDADASEEAAQTATLGQPVALLDGQFAIHRSIRFQVGSGRAAQTGALVECSEQVYNGSLLAVHVQLSLHDKYGNAVSTAHGRCAVVVVSRRSGEVVARQPLAGDGVVAGVQTAEIIVIEPPLEAADKNTSGRTKSQWPHTCKVRREPRSCTLALALVQAQIGRAHV